MNPPPRLRPTDALFLDFDGTLAGLVDDPEAAVISPRQGETLLALAEWLDGALAVISGRALDDLARRVPAGVMRIGGHGLQIAGPGREAPPRPESPLALTRRIEALMPDFPGARIEAKGPVLAIHYRAAPGLRVPLGNALADAVGSEPGYGLHGGKLVYEAKPDGANKGAALGRVMEADPFAGRRPVMLGDDVTDEDGFAAAVALGGHGVKVGEGPSKARYRLSGIGAVWSWLAEAM